FDSSPKFDYIEEFSGELMPTSIINEECIKREHEEYISLMEKLLTIDSFPHPLENFHANTIIETLPTSPIPFEDGDSLREEIDIFTSTDDLMPSGIESNDYNSKGDIHFLEELLSSDSISLLENESSNFDHYDDPSFPQFKVIHKKSSISLNNTSQIYSVNAIALVLPTEEPEYSLSMRYKHLCTILKTESDKVIKSSVKNIVQIPIEYEVTSDDESDDDEALSNEDVPMENFKICSNPLFDDDEINYDKVDPHYFNAESDLIESLSNHDTLFDSSPKFDYIEEFSGELMPTSIINEE
nr:hypothetical protein [Tanacetum cinerariifolium]